MLARLQYFKKCYQKIAIDLSKRQALGANPKVKQQINFTGNLEVNGAIVFIIDKAKETILDFFTRELRSICSGHLKHMDEK